MFVCPAMSSFPWDSLPSLLLGWFKWQMTHPSILSRADTNGWMDGYRLPIKSCELPVNRRCVGEVCPSLLLEMVLFACSGADMTGFLAAGTSDHSCTNNKNSGYLKQQTDSSSCSLAQIPLLLCDSFWPAGHQVLSMQGPHISLLDICGIWGAFYSGIPLTVSHVFTTASKLHHQL